jgi:hypothetical protein
VAPPPPTSQRVRLKWSRGGELYPHTPLKGWLSTLAHLGGVEIDPHKRVDRVAPPLPTTSQRE